MQSRTWSWKRGMTAFFCGVTLFVLAVFCWRLGQEVQRAREGEITPAQVIEEIGAWLRGVEE